MIIEWQLFLIFKVLIYFSEGCLVNPTMCYDLRLYQSIAKVNVCMIPSKCACVVFMALCPLEYLSLTK